MAVTKRLREAMDDPAALQRIVDERRGIRMDKIDKLSPDVRECVHDYGWKIVDAFMGIGVTKARHIRHLVEIVLNEFSPTRGSSSNQGTRADWRGIDAEK